MSSTICIYIYIYIYIYINRLMYKAKLLISLSVSEVFAINMPTIFKVLEKQNTQINYFLG